MLALSAYGFHESHPKSEGIVSKIARQLRKYLFNSAQIVSIAPAVRLFIIRPNHPQTIASTSIQSPVEWNTGELQICRQKWRSYRYIDSLFE